MIDPTGLIIREHHGIARGSGGAQLLIYGGVLPWRAEYIWGETFIGETGFYHSDFPQGRLLTFSEADLSAVLAATERVRDAINSRNVRYPWPALWGANSNAYYGTLIACLGLSDIRLDRGLWAPSTSRKLLSASIIKDIARDMAGISQKAAGGPS